MTLHIIDYVILAVYFAFVLGIGWRLKRSVSTSSDFLTSRHSVPLWITSLAFVAANLGAQELIGMCASGAKYGIMTVHFYWVGAIPAMVFMGLFMMPFYSESKARSVPEYLKLRFDERTRGFNAISFAVMTVFSSGISMYALGLLLQLVLGWSFTSSVLLSAAVVLAYTLLGGLTSAIYNEVLQFFLIVVGFAPLAYYSAAKAGGWGGIKSRLPEVMTHTWLNTGHASQNPMGVDVFSLLAGLGFVLSFGYWCTNFLVVQRAMAARSKAEARLTPIVGAIPKMMLPAIVILPGLAAVALSQMDLGYALPRKGDGYDYDQVLTTLMAQFYPAGMLGVGLTGLMASFMSGMAGNITAFNTVWTYDIYQSYINKNAPDSHYLKAARVSTVAGVVLSIGCAYLATLYNNIMDLLQLVFSFVNAPLFATFLLGMFWKRATARGAFYGLMIGTGSAAMTMALTVAEGKGGWIAPLVVYPSSMAQNFWIAFWAFAVCFVATLVISLTSPPRAADELKGLVWGSVPLSSDDGITPWYKKPALIGALVLVVCIYLNWIFR